MPRTNRWKRAEEGRGVGDVKRGTRTSRQIAVNPGRWKVTEVDGGNGDQGR